MNLSIIVPIYNSGDKGLEKCLNSILDQEWSDFELIAVNDGSTDNSLDICRKIADSDVRIRIIDKPNGGVSSARNAGLAVCSGEYVTFIDSDDFVSPDYLAGLMKHAMEADLVVCGMKQKFKDGRVKSYYPPKGKLSVKDAEAFHLLVQSRLLFGPVNKVFRTDIIHNNNIVFPEDIDYGEDRLFCFEYLKHIQTFCGIDSVSYDYLIQTSDSLSTVHRDNLFDLEYSQWRRLYELYEYLDVLSETASEDLCVELYWIVSDAIARLKTCDKLSREHIAHVLSVAEIDRVKRYCSKIEANRIMKQLILSRNAMAVNIFYKLLNKRCKK